MSIDTGYTIKARFNHDQIRIARDTFPLLGVDPGVTTGLAYFVADLPDPGGNGNSDTTEATITCVTLCIAWPRQAYMLEGLVHQSKVVAAEDYRVYPSTSAAGPIEYQALVPIEVLGHLKALVQGRPPASSDPHEKDGPVHPGLGTAPYLVLAMAQKAKELWTVPELKKVGINPPNPHQKDAVRHALTFLLEILLGR